MSSRIKMNDYLCRQFMVEEILHDISEGTTAKSRSIPLDSYGTNKMSAMQTDQGSSAYNAWLTKYTKQSLLTFFRTLRI